MPKGEHREHKAVRLERLRRFIAWAEARYPDFVAKRHHQVEWFQPYVGFPYPHFGRAAKAFWLGLGEVTATALSDGAPAGGLLGRVLANERASWRCDIDLFGAPLTLDCGAPTLWLAAEWATRLADSDSPDAFERHARQAVEAYARDTLRLLEAPFAAMSADERARCAARIPPVLARLEEFLPRAVETLNEVRHELRHLVRLRHGDVQLEVQRRVPSGGGELLDAAQVEAYKEADRRELQEKFDQLIAEAGDFDLKQLGQRRLAELFQLEPGRMRRALRVARRDHEERMAFAVLLENDPRFVHYHQAYPARALRRQWTALLGPTNSGKTHRSIEAMLGVTHAIYLSPLRLMALENQERIESMGVPCSLVTGEEQIIREGATHYCCTVEEFARFRHQRWDVVVVDEVQMLADPQRGWAWVDALVAAHAPEILMTGPALIEPSLRRLCALCDDELVVKRTKRLSPVDVARQATSLRQLEPGSMLVAFSRRTVLELKGILEMNGRRVSVVYGALSPEVRREQARRFREGETDIMVATDAVGMGLNLPAHTLCFYTDEKFDGVQQRQLGVQEVKQIGGRAGRFGHHDQGCITALEPPVLKNIRRLFHCPDEPVDLTQFQVRPSIEHLSAIAGLMNEPSLLRAWATFNRNINYGEHFVSILPDELADWIKLIDDPQIPLWLRWIFACTPIRGGLESPAAQLAQKWLRQVAEDRQVHIPRLAIDADLATLEASLHVIETYLHLARALPGHFPEVDKGEAHRQLLNAAVTRELSRSRRPQRGGRRSGGAAPPRKRAR